MLPVRIRLRQPCLFLRTLAPVEQMYQAVRLENAPELLPGSWQCRACTYVNYPGRTVCEVCGAVNKQQQHQGKLCEISNHIFHLKNVQSIIKNALCLPSGRKHSQACLINRFHRVFVYN